MGPKVTLKAAAIAFFLIAALLVASASYLELTGTAGAHQTTSSNSQSDHHGPLIELYPSSVYVIPGQSENYTSVNVYPLNVNFSGSYIIFISGLASGISADISSTPTNLPFGERSYELILTAEPNVPSGTYKMTVNLTNAPTNTSAVFNFEVDPFVVFMNNYRYYPSNLTVTKGTTVTWYNLQGLDVFLDDYGIHNVVLNASESIVSPNILQYGTWSLTFNADGVHPYYCTFHPSMRGVILVTG